MLKIEWERKRQKEIELANKWKQYEEKLKSELKSLIPLKCQKEQEQLEMKSIKEKFGQELELQVRQEMILPIKKLPVPHLPDPIPGMSSNPGPSRITPPSLLSIKREKLDHDAYVDPLSPTRHGKKRKDVEHLTTPSSKRFATKLDFQQTFTPAKNNHIYNCFHHWENLLHCQ